MIRAEVTFVGQVDAAFSDDAIETMLGEVMAVLVDLGADDPDVAATIAERRIEVTVAVEAPDLHTAAEFGHGYIATAVEKAGLWVTWTAQHAALAPALVVS